MHANGDDEREQELTRLPRHLAPPGGLEHRVAAALKRQGLIQSARPPLPKRAALVLLPLLVGFAAGWGAKSASTRPITPVPREQPRFVFLLYGSPTQSSADAVEQYRAWARRLAAGGTEVSGEKLASDVELLVGVPFSGAAQLRGFFIVQAPDVREARELARSHPHVKGGGTIVVRRIDPT